MGLLDGMLGGGGSSGGGGFLGGLFGGGSTPSTPAQFGFPGAAPYSGFPVPAQSAPQPGLSFSGSLSGPGPAENYFQQHAGAFSQPTQAGQYWNGVAGAQANHPQATNNAQTAFTQFQNSQPANMDPYFQNAQGLLNAGLNNQFAARGMFGSSAATNAIGQADTNLAAQQAYDEANYGLQRGGLLGQLASGADLSSRGLSANELGWLTGLGGLAQGADQAQLAQLGLGGQLAGNAQNALSNRAGDYFDQLMALANAQAGAQMGLGQQSIGTALGLYDQAIQAALGYPRDAFNQSVQGRANTEQGIGNLFGLFGLGGGKGGGGMLGGIL